MSRRKGRPLVRGRAVSSIIALGLMLVSLLPTLANATPAHVAKSNHNGHVKVTPPEPSLTASWWKEFVAVAGQNPLGRCDVGTGKIVFLPGTTGGTATRSCTTDKAKTFLVPLINIECSEAEGNGNTYEVLRACSEGVADDFTYLTLVVDGKAIGDLDRLRVQAESVFTPIDGNAFGIPAVADSKFASDGYWALVKLTPGEHTLTFGGSYPPVNFTTQVTYHLTVKK